MPIRAENKGRYPKDWHQISQRIRERAGQKCEFCGVENYALGAWKDGVWWTAAPKGTGLRDDPRPGEHCPHFHVGSIDAEWLKVTRIVLTVAHLDHTPENCTNDNLKALCQRCHNRYDMPMRRAGIRQRDRAAMACADLFPQPEAENRLPSPANGGEE